MMVIVSVGEHVVVREGDEVGVVVPDEVDVNEIVGDVVIVVVGVMVGVLVEVIVLDFVEVGDGVLDSEKVEVMV
jgi:hypothetical protein